VFPRETPVCRAVSTTDFPNNKNSNAVRCSPANFSTAKPFVPNFETLDFSPPPSPDRITGTSAIKNHLSTQKIAQYNLTYTKQKSSKKSQ